MKNFIQNKGTLMDTRHRYVVRQEMLQDIL